VPDSSFYTNRPIAGVAPEILAAGPNKTPPPTGAFTIGQVKTAGFLGQDPSGQKYMVKLDHPDYPQLGCAAEIIASRIYWALGYYVPETYLVTIEGTNDDRFDGKRAIASRFIPGNILGIYKFDWLRLRREFRALKLAAAWLNDVDRSDNNNLAGADDGMVTFYMLDFNSALGSWQGRPKEIWQGRRYRWDVEKQLFWLLTFGLADYDNTLIDIEIIDNKTLGYLPLQFDVEKWRSEKPNTAFDYMTDQDAVWMVNKIAQFSSDQLRAIVNEAHLDDPGASEKLLQALLARRESIITCYTKKSKKN